MSKSKKSAAFLKAAQDEVSAKVREKSHELILPADKPTEPKTNKKQAMLDLLRRPEGVTIAELEKATGWQQHSVRGALVNLKNKDKHPITNSKDENGPRLYFLKSEDAPVESDNHADQASTSEVMA